MSVRIYIFFWQINKTVSGTSVKDRCWRYVSGWNDSSCLRFICFDEYQWLITLLKLTPAALINTGLLVVITALKMAQQLMKSGVYVLAQFPFIFVSVYIYKLERQKNTSWMREVFYWQLKSQIPADQHSRAGPNSQPTMTRIHNKWCNQTCSSQLKLRTKQISIMRSQHLTNNTFDVKRRNMITRFSLVMNRTVVDSVSRFHLTTCAVEAPVTVNHNPPQDCRVPQMIPYRKWSRDRKWSPKWTANDPQPQVISKVDRKWSRENLRNGMDFMGLITKKDYCTVTHPDDYIPPTKRVITWLMDSNNCWTQWMYIKLLLA